MSETKLVFKLRYPITDKNLKGDVFNVKIQSLNTSLDSNCAVSI